MKRKYNAVHSLTHNMLTICLVILIIAFSVGMYFVGTNIIEIREEVNILKSSQAELEMVANQKRSNNDVNKWYIEISEKADAEMSRLVTIVGLLATVYTVFGALIVFKAPKDIDIRMKELGNLVSQANKAAEDAKYQAKIVDAVLNNYNGKMTNYDKLRRISAIIENYPNKGDAYIQRAFIYDNMKKFDEAIQDYKIGHRYKGIDDASYYCDIGIAYRREGEYKKALSAYTKSIKIDSNEPSVYVNRGICYAEQDDFSSAMDDFDKAINLDDEFKQAYMNRAITYGKLFDKESDNGKRKEYLSLMIADLRRVIELDPEDVNAKKLLARRMAPKQMEVKDMMADIDEEVGDIANKAGHHFEAFKQYIEAAKHYVMSALITKDHDKLDNVSNLICKIYAIDEAEIVPKLAEISDSLSDFWSPFCAVSIMLYEGGRIDVSEKAFQVLRRYNKGDDNNTVALNLAFMKRRGETTVTEQSLKELLNQVGNKTSAIWCINVALCYICAAEGYEYSWDKALEVMNSANG